MDNNQPELKENYTFLIVGDSISKGVIYNEDQGKYSLLDRNYVSLVQNSLKGMVYNAAKFGNTIKKGIERLNRDVSKTCPDIVLIEFGGNDCDFDWMQIANDPMAEHEPKTDFNVFGKMLTDTIISLKNNNIIPVLMTLPPLDADRYFKWISKNSNEIGKSILIWLGSVTKIYWWQERYNSMIVNIAEETRTRWIDVRGAFLKTPDFTQLLCIDGIHPNEDGHKVIAQKVTEYLRQNYNFLLKDSSAENLS
ncbi:MAG: SGNH/GDSL hydrolase family protein [Dehalobacter sp. 4CP]|uniref:SGNH/GDSL hydrolase family protein n=1 Tax=Dehalobacter sp. CP TaxID=2594474 RepID=UPI0013CC2458|nr:SGNH/GDSL hydrolase family protein [Dehalobacter sp.]NBJ15245.1 SGNH/GDSL hydrolase family protein [Dehalobacter sp. 4CP]